MLSAPGVKADTLLLLLPLGVAAVLPLLMLLAISSPAALALDHAVIVSTSAEWLNYRHAGDALAMTRLVLDLGLPEARLRLLLGDHPAYDPRNPFPGVVYADARLRDRTWGDRKNGDPEVTLCGDRVTPLAMTSLLTGRNSLSVPPNMRLDSGPNDDVLLFISGHGGIDFYKFRETDVLWAKELADAVDYMWHAGRFGRLLIIFETCHAESFLAHLKTPNVVAIATSRMDEDSVAASASTALGLAPVDEVTLTIARYMSRLQNGPSVSLSQLMTHLHRAKLRSHPVVRYDLLAKRAEDVDLGAFFRGSKYNWEHAPGWKRSNAASPEEVQRAEAPPKYTMTSSLMAARACWPSEPTVPQEQPHPKPPPAMEVAQHRQRHGAGYVICLGLTVAAAVTLWLSRPQVADMQLDNTAVQAKKEE